jgi:hypothetical protein
MLISSYSRKLLLPLPNQINDIHTCSTNVPKYLTMKAPPTITKPYNTAKRTNEHELQYGNCLEYLEFSVSALENNQRSPSKYC